MRSFFAVVFLWGLLLNAKAQEINLSVFNNRLDSVRKIVLSPIKYQISYDYAYRLDRKDTFDVRKEPMLLQVGDSHLRFVSAHLYTADTIQDNAYNRGVESYFDVMRARSRALRSAQFEEQLLCDLAGQEVRVIVPIVIDQWIYTEDLPSQSWQLVEGDSTILGYSCHKAKTSFRGRNYTAYYTPELPLPYGPWKFGGLPGLILCVGDDNGEHVYTAVGLEQLKEYRPLYQPILRREKKASRKEVQGMQANYTKDPAMILRSLPQIKIDPKELEDIKPIPYNPQELE